ncbi:HPr family phosphocarrier protein [Arthrobacter sp. R1-13]
MPVRKAIVESEIGLHARPAARFVRAVTETGLPVTISKAGISPVDARSLLEVMTADFECGCEVELSVDPEALPAGFLLTDAEGALTALGALLEAMETDQRVSRLPALASDQAAIS